MKAITEQSIKNDQLLKIDQRLKVIEEKVQTPVDNAKEENAGTLQEQLSLLDKRIKAHEEDSLKTDDLVKEQLLSFETMIQTNEGFNLTGPRDKLSSLEQQIQNNEGVSAEKNDLESLKEYISTVEQKVQSITDAHIAFLSQPIHDHFFGLNNETFCVPWAVNVDAWWTHHVDWSVSKENETHQCFSPKEDPEKAEFFRKLYNIQFKGNCSKVFTKLMWSSGWSADMRNVIDGLQQAVKTNQPMQLYAAHPWHYAHADPDRSVCPSKDYRCYFLDLSNCKSDPESPVGNLLNQKIRLDKIPGTWYYEFATRQQTWLRLKVFRFSNKINITTPCTVAHVRRADIVLHKNRVRRYHEIDDYVKRMDNGTKNIFLLTDDDNAIGEALTKYPDYHWMYIDRPRHKGAEGGFENQVQSKNPKFEVVVLLSIFRLVKKCSTLIHSKSGFALLLSREMSQDGLRVVK